MDERRNDDLDREVQNHLDLEADEQRERGLSAEEARHAARRALGNPTRIKEITREIWGFMSIDRIRQDLRYALRTMRSTPALTTVALLSLGLGIGANTAIFSLLNAVILRDLPVHNPEQLVQFTYTTPGPGPNNWNSWMGYPQFERFRDKNTTLSGVFGGTGVGRLNLAYRGSSGLAQGDAYTTNFFSVLGVQPQSGRFFLPDEEKTGAPVVVLSDRYWRSRFGEDPSIVGASVTINQIAFTVIGIAPREFRGISVGTGPDLWVPLRAIDRLQPRNSRWTESFSSWMMIAGRLRDGVSLESAQAELDVIHRQLLAEQLAASELRNRENMQRFVRESRLVLRPGAKGMFSGLRDRYGFPLKLLMVVAGIVLLVACANVANLLLARASNRQREIAVRLALGAGRARVVRQLLTESVLLASVGGGLALAIAWWGSDILVRMISTGDTPIPLDVRPDWRVFGFTAVISLATGVIFGLAPALRGTRIDPGPAIREGARSIIRSSRVLDRSLVVVQVALSVVLIVGAGLFTRSLQNMLGVDLGFVRENVLMFSVDAKLGGHSSERAGAVYREILDRLRNLRDVHFAAASLVRPVDDHFYLVDVVRSLDGRRLAERDEIRVAWNATSPGYFATVGTPILLGRDFELRDNESAPEVVIVNESFVRRAFPGQNPIGRRVEQANIVGVVKDSHYNGVRDQPRPVLYRPLFQYGRSQGFQWGFVSYQMRYRSGQGLVDEARREVAAVDRNLPVFRIKTLRAQTEASLLRERLLAMLSSYFGGLALLLACLGLYGLMAYAVSRRTAEIGIRVALGARRGHVMWIVLRETFLLSLAGIALGIPLAVWMARYIKTLLFGVEPADPVTILAATSLLMVIAGISGYLPARRALRVDPTVALRCE